MSTDRANLLMIVAACVGIAIMSHIMSWMSPGSVSKRPNPPSANTPTRVSLMFYVMCKKLIDHSCRTVIFFIESVITSVTCLLCITRFGTPVWLTHIYPTHEAIGKMTELGPADYYCARNCKNDINPGL